MCVCASSSARGHTVGAVKRDWIFGNFSFAIHPHRCLGEASYQHLPHQRVLETDSNLSFGGLGGVKDSTVQGLHSLQWERT